MTNPHIQKIGGVLKGNRPGRVGRRLDMVETTKRVSLGRSVAVTGVGQSIVKSTSYTA